MYRGLFYVIELLDCTEDVAYEEGVEEEGGEDNGNNRPECVRYMYGDNNGE